MQSVGKHSQHSFILPFYHYKGLEKKMEEIKKKMEDSNHPAKENDKYQASGACRRIIV